MAPSAVSPPDSPIVKKPKPQFTVEEFDSATAKVEDLIDSLIHNGGCIIRNLLTTEELAQIERDTRPYIEDDFAWEGEFFPKETRRVLGLAAKSPTYLKRICLHPLFKAVCDAILTSKFEYWVGDKLETSYSRPQLNSTSVFSIGPGARAQGLHRDDMIHHTFLPEITAEEYKPGRDTAIGCFVAGKKTTRANGATRFVPGSHLQLTSTPPVEEEAFYAELEPGDAFIMLASCYHGGSANTTEDEERLVYGTFVTKGMLRQVYRDPFSIAHIAC